MYKKVIEFVDYNDQKKTKECYFNLNKVELLDLELSYEGGLEKMVTDMVSAGNSKAIMDFFKKIVDISYGQKTEDGGFTKDPEELRKFKETAAYPELFTQLVTDETEASNFIKMIMPAEMRASDADINEAKNRLSNIPAPQRR